MEKLCLVSLKALIELNCVIICIQLIRTSTVKTCWCSGRPTWPWRTKRELCCGSGKPKITLLAHRKIKRCTAEQNHMWLVSVWMWLQVCVWPYLCVSRLIKKLLSCWRSWAEAKHDAFKNCWIVLQIFVTEVVFHWFLRWKLLTVIQNKPAIQLSSSVSTC